MNAHNTIQHQYVGVCVKDIDDDFFLSLDLVCVLLEKLMLLCEHIHRNNSEIFYIACMFV